MITTNLLTIIFKKCLNFRHFSKIFTFILGVSSFSAMACDQDCQRWNQLGMFYTETTNRAPANFIPNDELAPLPIEQRIWLQNIFVEDDAGILNEITNNIKTWEEQEDFIANWDLDSTGTYVVPSQEEKRAYLGKKMLKYLDKRLSGEIKRADEGSTLHRVGQVHQALRPTTKFKVSSKIKVRFKARVLQGKAIILVDNPYVEYHTDIKATGRVNMHLKKDIKELKLEAKIDYNLNEGTWLARLDHKLISNVMLSVYSTQSDKDIAFTSGTNRVMGLFYGKPF